MAGAAIVLFIDRKIEEEVERRVRESFAARYPDLHVSLDSARLIQNEGIEIRGLTLSDPAGQGPAAELAFFDEFTLACDTSLQQLAAGPPAFRCYTLRRPRLRISRSADGGWNLAKLIPREDPNCPQGAVPCEIKNALIELIDHGKQPPSVLELRDVHVKLVPTVTSVEGEDTQAAPAGGAALEFSGSFAVGDFGRVEFTASHDVARGTWKLTADAPQLKLTGELLRLLPAELLVAGDLLAGVNAQVELHCDLSYDPARPAPLEFQAVARLTKGRIDDRRLPFPFTEAEGLIVVSQQGVRVEDLVLKNRRTTLRVRGGRQGWRHDSPLTLEFEGRNIVFDRRLRELLPETMHSSWDDFSPEGEADLVGRLKFDGRQWQPEITATALNVGLLFCEFPYPLTRTTGTLKLIGDRLLLDLTGFARTDRVRIMGDLRNPGPQAVGYVQVAADGVRMNEELLSATDKDSQAVIRSFAPSGTFDAYYRIWREPSDPDFSDYLRLTLHEVSARYEHFPYRLHNVKGVIDKPPSGVWRFADLTATNDDAHVAGHGEFDPRAAGAQLKLWVEAQNVALNGELKEALDSDTQYVWDQLQPRGEINLITNVSWPNSRGDVDLWLQFEPRGEGVAIQPRLFPYRWEKLQGKFTYRTAEFPRVIFDDVSAVHDDVRLRCRGDCGVSPAGGWDAHLQNLTIDRVRTDRDLLAALPESARQTLADIKLMGPVNVAGWDKTPGGELRFGQGPPTDDRLWLSWDVGVYCHRNSLAPGIELTDIYGGVRLTGGLRDGQLKSRGELALDSLNWRDYQFTEVSGPLLLENRRLLIGSPDAPGLQPGRYPHVQARLLGGVVHGDGWVAGKDPAAFSLRGTLTQADLARIAQESVPGQQTYTGRIDATLSLRGNDRGAASLLGDGQVRLTDANLYELPVMLRLLKMLSLREPDKVAFTTGDIDYRIVGDRFYFDRIRLAGDAINLEGKGEIGFDRGVRLTFDTNVGNGGLYVPVVTDLLRGAGRQINQLHVGGTLDEPEVQNEPFPALNQAMQQLDGPPRTPVVEPAPQTSRSPNLNRPR